MAFSGVIFSLVALLHLLRLVYAWPMVLGTWNAPMWLSILGVVLGGTLAYGNFKYRS